MGALDGLGALVTGGGSGIGAGCALALARDGASVTICGRTESKLEVAAERLREVVDRGAEIRTIVADVTKEEDVQAAVAAAAQPEGRLDAVVASAGGPVLDSYHRNIPLGRVGTVDDVASLVRFLAGPESSFITGQCIGIDGGQTLRSGADFSPFAEPLYRDQPGWAFVVPSDDEGT